jgi:hypothetical protein
VNRPPAKTVFPEIAIAFTLLLVCHEVCLIAETAEPKPGVAASTGGPEGISAAASTAAPVTRASTNFFIDVLRTGGVEQCVPHHAPEADTSAVGGPLEADLLLAL